MTLFRKNLLWICLGMFLVWLGFLLEYTLPTYSIFCVVSGGMIIGNKGMSMILEKFR